MSTIKEAIAQRWAACSNDAERYEVLAEINSARKELRRSALRGDYNLRGALAKLDDMLDTLVFRPIRGEYCDRADSYDGTLPALPALVGHIWGLFMLRVNARAKAAQELRYASAGKESILHEWRIEESAERGLEPLDIQCGICDAGKGEPCTNKIKRFDA